MNRRAFGEIAVSSVVAARLRPMATKLGPIGIQLYTVRDLFAKDPEATLTALGAAGYREVEFAGYQNLSAKAVKAMLTRAGLTAPSAHIDLTQIRTKWPATLEFAKEIGHRYLVLAYLDQADSKNLDDYRKAADALNLAATAAKAVGIEVAYHNHATEFVPMGGTLPYDVLLAATDRSLVKFEMDLYWVTKGGADPLDYFAKHPGRFPLVHVKDMAKAETKDMVDLGTGRIDFAKIFAHGAEAGIKHYFVEHDQPKDPLEFARRALTYLKALEY
jgi:sugar phosphate isomerase/epimerase